MSLKVVFRSSEATINWWLRDYKEEHGHFPKFPILFTKEKTGTHAGAWIPYHDDGQGNLLIMRSQVRKAIKGQRILEGPILVHKYLPIIHDGLRELEDDVIILESFKNRYERPFGLA